ncbi:MAG TPA: ABC transporter ATP-binding protein [Acetobacteraceae bacterium]|nr:ABC transporter ATP-binding protein [Acetobacteraceae bacterium]
MTPLLRLSGLRKRYGSLAATDSVDLEVAAGEAVGIIGPNGAGKSTLFNLIAGDVRPNAGRVVFAGRDITRLPAHARARLGIGRSYQIPLPFRRMTVFENVLVGAAFAGASRLADARAHCAGVLARTGLIDKADHPAGGLTLLERKRLELARALATAPSLLLLDEIAGGLSEAESHALLETIRAIHRDGATIIWIEHVLHALVPVISRLVVLSFGRKLADGAPLAVLKSPVVREIYLGIEEEMPA